MIRQALLDYYWSCYPSFKKVETRSKYTTQSNFDRLHVINRLEKKKEALEFILGDFYDKLMTYPAWDMIRTVENKRRHCRRLYDGDYDLP